MCGLVLSLAACTSGVRNSLLPEVETVVAPALEITELAESAELDQGFATAEPLVVEHRETGGSGLDSAEIAPEVDAASFVSEARALETANDIATQQLVMSEMVSLIWTNYLDETANGVDWQAVLEDNQNSIAPLSDADFWLAMSDALALLEDRDAYYMSPAEVQAYEQMVRGKEGKAGIGIVTMPRPDSQDALIAWAIEGNAAYTAGIRSGDRLVSVNNAPSCCNEYGLLHGGLRGKLNSTVMLTVQTASGPKRWIQVRRQPLLLANSVEAQRFGEIGVMTIHSFVAETTGEEVEAAWEQLNAQGGLSGLVVDVRPNTGGFEEEMSQALGLFLNGKVGTFRNRQGIVPLNVFGQNRHSSQSIPLVVLIGEATGNQAEIFAGVLQDFQRATLVGAATQGKLTSIFPHDLSDGSRVWLPEDQFERLDGSSWAGTGLTPDVPISQNWSDIGWDDNDLALAAAIVSLRDR